MNPAPLSPDADLAAVLGRTPSGLFIVTARSADGLETGMLASWVQQAAFDPPAVTLAVNRKRYLHQWLEHQPRLVLNLIGEDQKGFINHFARGFEPDDAAFTGLETVRTPAGLPALAGALGWMEGAAASHMEAGDHIVYLVQITAAARGPEFGGQKPWVHIRKTGLNY